MSKTTSTDDRAEPMTFVKEPTGRQSKVLLLTKKFSGLDTDQRRMDLAKIQSITDPYELDLMVNSRF